MCNDALISRRTKHLLLGFPAATMKSMKSPKKRAGSVEEHPFDYLGLWGTAWCWDRNGR